MSEDALLEIRDLSMRFRTYAGEVRALDHVNLVIRRGETLGLVGESGCGKSVTAMSILRLVPTPPGLYTDGKILFRPEPGRETDLLALPEDALARVRGNDVSMIFQEPMTSLNPVMRVGDQITEAVLRHQTLGLSPPSAIERWLEARGWRATRRLRERASRARALAAEMLTRIGIADPPRMLDRYPHELSGGMRQRIMIAMALACRPHLLVADEPTTALDVTIQAQIMALMKDLKEEEGASILLITHHLGLVAEMCDRVAVMYAGSVVETASVRDAFHAPAHPYTVGLLKSIPAVEGHRGELPVIPGSVPDLIRPPAGCRFHARCPFAFDRCREARPPLLAIGKDHEVACHLYAPGATIPEALKSAGIKPRPEASA